MKVRGVQVDVLDNDDNGYISVVDQTKGYHLMSEDGLLSEQFQFHIFPTQKPDDNVVVEIVAPVARNGETFLLVNDKEIEKFTFTSTNYAPRSVTVSYNPLVLKLTVTEVNLMLKLLVKLDGDEDTTFDEKFRQTEQVSYCLSIYFVSLMSWAGRLIYHGRQPLHLTRQMGLLEETISHTHALSCYSNQ